MPVLGFKLQWHYFRRPTNKKSDKRNRKKKHKLNNTKQNKHKHNKPYKKTHNVEADPNYDRNIAETKTKLILPITHINNNAHFRSLIQVPQ